MLVIEIGENLQISAKIQLATDKHEEKYFFNKTFFLPVVEF